MSVRYVFEGGPLDGHEIEAVRRTGQYRDETGTPVSVVAGRRRADRQGGLYGVARRPMRVAEGGRMVRRPGAFRWLRPVIREGAR